MHEVTGQQGMQTRGTGCALLRRKVQDTPKTHGFELVASGFKGLPKRERERERERRGELEGDRRDSEIERKLGGAGCVYPGPPRWTCLLQGACASIRVYPAGVQWLAGHQGKGSDPLLARGA